MTIKKEDSATGILDASKFSDSDSTKPKFKSKEIEELFNYRIKLFRDAFDHKKTERIPFYGNIQQWMYINAGYTMLEAARDYDKCFAAGRKLHDMYQMDMMSIGYGIVRNSTLIYDALGQSKTWDAPGSGNNINAIFEDEMIKADEYDELIENYEKAIWEKALFRTFEGAKELSLEGWVNAVKVSVNHYAMKVRSNVMLREEYGLVDTVNILASADFANTLLDSYRGLKGLSMDLRRRPEKLEQICTMRNDAVNKPLIEKIKATNERNMNEPYDVLSSFLAYILMTTKQFEKYCLPSFAKIAKACEDTGKQMVLNTEAEFMRFGDYFNEYKKGTINAIVEMDDPFEIRKRYPNIGILGGLSVDMMGKSTPEKCVDMAKKAIDELGCNGGFVLANNKFVTYPYDMKAENLKAVGEFVMNYRI